MPGPPPATYPTRPRVRCRLRGETSSTPESRTDRNHTPPGSPSGALGLTRFDGRKGDYGGPLRRHRTKRAYDTALVGPLHRLEAAGGWRRAGDPHAEAFPCRGGASRRYWRGNAVAWGCPVTPGNRTHPPRDAARPGEWTGRGLRSLAMLVSDPPCPHLDGQDRARAVGACTGAGERQTGSVDLDPEDGYAVVMSDHATIPDLSDFTPLDPFFRIIETGLAGIADGPHFFDLLAEDVVFDYIITVPGYPRHVEGRTAVAELYRPYGRMIHLHRCHDLAVHHDRETGVVVLEYASEGRVVPTGARYTNRYISVLTITERKVTHWRDYLDPVAVFDALGWPSR